MKRFKKLLFLAESGADNTAALARAFTLAEENQADLLVASALDLQRSKTSGRIHDLMVGEREEELNDLLKGRSLSAGTVETKVLIGKPFIETIREVIRNDRDLVIKPSDSVGVKAPGGTDMRLLRKCPCPVWIIASAEQRGFREILVALDWDPENSENERLNRNLMELAVSLALADFAELHVVHAWQLGHESFLRSPRMGLTKSEVDEMVEDEREKHEVWLSELVSSATDAFGADAAEYLKPELHLVKGNAPEVVSRSVRGIGAELLIMGTVARTGVPGFVIGNTAERILSQIDCSILAVKPEGFVSPIS